jgi:glycosyltransferase involved in cell wall biosynthesis
MDLNNTKICLIAHTYYDRDGRVRRYAETLANACYQVDVISLRDKDQSSFKLKNGVRIFTIPYQNRSKKRGHYLLEYGLSFILFSIWLFCLFTKHHYHIIHVHNMPDFLIFTAFIPRVLGAKLILDIHDPMPEVYQCKFPEAREGLGLQTIQLQERLSTGFAHSVITANHLFKENINKRGVPWDKITVINNVAEEKIFNKAKYSKVLGDQNQPFTLIYIGTIAHRYRLDIPIRAIPILINTIPEIRLKIIGSMRDGSEELPALVDQLQIAPYVHFMPAIPIDEIPQHLIRADIGIYTATPGPHMSIATPTKVLEYTAMGLPTVASRLPILEDLYTQGSIQFFEPGSPQDFACAVIDLYEHPSKRTNLVRTADRSNPQSLAWQRERISYMKLLGSLIGEMAVDEDPILKEIA